MILQFENYRNGWRYYPANEAAIELVAAFGNGRGKRTCLTQKQIDLLEACGVHLQILK